MHLPEVVALGRPLSSPTSQVASAFVSQAVSLTRWSGSEQAICNRRSSFVDGDVVVAVKHNEVRPRTASSSLPRLTATRQSNATSARSTAVRRIRSAEDFQASLSSAGSTKLTVIAFTARDCRACQYARRAYARAAADLEATAATVATTHPAASTRAVDFFELDVGAPALRDVCRSLGVEAVPMWQVYADDEQGQLFELDRVVGPRNVDLLKQSVERLVRDGVNFDEYELQPEQNSSAEADMRRVDGFKTPTKDEGRRWWWF